MDGNFEPNSSIPPEKKISRPRFFKIVVGAFLALIFLIGGVIVWRAIALKNERDKANAVLNQPKPDEIVITKLPNGDQLVENKTQGYKVELPKSWKVENPLPNVPGTSVYNQNLACKVVSGFQEHENRSPSKIIEDYLNEETPYLTVKYKKVVEITAGGANQYKGLALFLNSEERGLYINSYISVDGRIFGFIVGGEKCDNPQQIFDEYLKNLRL